MSGTLTQGQLNTLKAFVANSTDPGIVDARTRGDTIMLANLLNADATPIVKAWGETVAAITLDDAANYNGYNALAQGFRDEWDIYLKYAPRDLSKLKNRNVVSDVWGAVTAGSISEGILLAGNVNTSVAQQAIGGTIRTTGTVAALARNFSGLVSQSDCQLILAP